MPPEWNDFRLWRSGVQAPPPTLSPYQRRFCLDFLDLIEAARAQEAGKGR